MLRIFDRFSQLDTKKLMAVYEEANRKKGAECFLYDPAPRQIEKAQRLFEDYLRDDFFGVRGAFYGVWDEENRYCSALRMEPYQDGLLLEALETAPGQRRRGYARRLLNQVLLSLPKGTQVYSHVDKANKASLAVHSACGFSRMLDHAKLLDGTVTNRFFTLFIET